MIQKSRRGFASIETTLELWASSLRDVKARMRLLFAQERTAMNAGLFLDGLRIPMKPAGYPEFVSATCSNMMPAILTR